MPKTKTQKIRGQAAVLHIEDIILHPELQSRASGTVTEHLEDLTQVLRKKAGKLPRVQVYKIPDPENEGKYLYFATDGHHTTMSHRLAGKTQVPVVIYTGTWEDAVLAAAKANNTAFHQALKRTNADKKRAVEMVLKVDPRMGAQRVADHVGVSDQFVRNVREELEAAGAVPTVDSTEAKDGRVIPRRSKPSANGKAHKISGESKPANGSTVGDVWRELDPAFGAVMRAADKVANAYPGEKSANEYQAFLRLADELAALYKSWRKRVEKDNPLPE